jgi:hypothetical protein
MNTMRTLFNLIADEASDLATVKLLETREEIVKEVSKRVKVDFAVNSPYGNYAEAVYRHMVELVRAGI